MEFIAIVSYRVAGWSRAGENPNAIEQPKMAEGTIGSDVKFTKTLWFFILFITLMRLALEAVVAVAFGQAWANEIITPETYDWNANKLAEVVATRVVSAAAFASFGGFCLGAVIGRFVVASNVSKPALLTFMCWILVVIASALPLLAMDVVDLANTEKFLEDCTVLYQGSFEKVACEFRQLSLVIVVISIALIFGILIASGCTKYIRAIWTGAKRRRTRLGPVSMAMLSSSAGGFDVPDLGYLIAYAPAEESRRLIAQLPVISTDVIDPRDLHR